MAELDRLYDLLTGGTGITRTRNTDLQREATERSAEARQQVGLTGSTPISHPSQTERESRLGVAWTGMGVTELAAWNYDYLDPIQALVDFTRSDGIKVGLLNSEPHRTILLDPRFKHWGIGLYTELPDGLEEWRRRYYCVVWMSINVPVVAPKQTFSDVPPGSLFYNDVEAMAAIGVARGFPDGTFRPNETVTRGQLMAFMNRERKAPPG